MLILTRKTHQKLKVICPGYEIDIEVLGVQGNQVRIGITAPKDVPIHRKEIYDRMRRELRGEPAGESKDVHPDVNGNIAEE